MSQIIEKNHYRCRSFGLTSSVSKQGVNPQVVIIIVCLCLILILSLKNIIAQDIDTHNFIYDQVYVLGLLGVLRLHT